MSGKQEAGIEASGARVRIHLLVSAPGSSRIYDLEPGATLLVGRSMEVAVQVDDDLVSRIHLQVERRGDGVFVQDRGSANGTWLNGRMVDERTALAPGDEVKIGGTVISIVEASALPRYRREVLPPSEILHILGYEIERSQARGIPLGVVLVETGRLPVPADLLESRIIDVLAAGDMVGHGPHDDGTLLLVLPEASRQRTEMIVRQFVGLVVDGPRKVGGIGTAIFPDDGMDVESLIGAAGRSTRKREWGRPSITPEAAAARDQSSVTLVSGITDEPDP